MAHLIPDRERLGRFDRYRGWALWSGLAFAFLLVGSGLAGRDYALAPPLPFLLVLCCAGSLLAFLWASTARHGKRVLWYGLALIPATLIAFLAVIFLTPVSDEMTRVRLPDGRIAHLSTDAAVITDVSYSVWISSPRSIFWRRPPDTNLSYSEDGSYIDDERLALSANGERLMVGRGGVWADCLEIKKDFTPCDLGAEQPWWSEPNYRAKMRAYSDVLEKARR